MTDVAQPSAPLPPDQAALISESFALVLPVKARLALRVYERFFELEPQTRHLFSADLAGQRAKIMQALSYTVRATGSDADLIRLAEGLARSHARFHISEDQLCHMAMAILGAFGDCLGDAFTSEMQCSWQAAFDRFLPMIVAAQDRLDAAG
ncbi:globin domain-containing protein [Nioella sp. MMSF_3534]|uniref:globin domain-containing protein n=1 Tax=Nioella sp. MMSF_3534 TaxID=3046720 RepID=UPI00273F12D1|nr:globin domain-containing protein [Nioella sp. MMSF_3534]